VEESCRWGALLLARCSAPVGSRGLRAEGSERTVPSTRSTRGLEEKVSLRNKVRNQFFISSFFVFSFLVPFSINLLVYILDPRRNYLY